MDKQPAEIEREIQQQRRCIAERLVALRDRLQYDAGETRSAWKRQSSRMGRRARRGSMYVAAALGLGIALRMGYSAWRRNARNKE